MASMYDLRATAAQDEARAACEAIGDRMCLSQFWRIRGNSRYYSGDFPGAQQAYGLGIGIARELGNAAELANLLVGLGVVAQANQNWKEAEKSLLEAISLKIDACYNPNEVRNVLADYIHMGQLAAAAEVLKTAETTARESNAHGDWGATLLLESAIARRRGRLNESRELAEHAVSELRQTGDP